MRFPDELNAAANLTGHTLDDGWEVMERVTRSPAGTGGLFSINYRVQGPQSRQAFLKVIDLADAVADIDRLQHAVNEFVFERDLVLMCGQQRLSRVVTAIGSGQLSLSSYALPQVNYIIFELATSDVRVALSQIKEADVVFRLQMLHDMAVGLQQLHQRRVAHQDFKPSNILVFPNVGVGERGKVGDLGRAFREDVPSLHDTFVRPGDGAYAPPEQLYRYAYGNMELRRFGADLYQLGSLASFIFTGLTMNARLSARIEPEFHWRVYGDSYDTVLPYLNEVFLTVMGELNTELPASVAAKLGGMIKYLCNPDAEHRGHPRNRMGNQNRLVLNRVVSELDLMAKQSALVALRAS